MVRIVDMPTIGRGFISDLEMIEFESPAWTAPVPASERRVAIVSTAAVSRRGEKPFSWLARDYRAINKNDRDLVMTHVAAEYDRTAWQQDLNAIMPLDRLEELAQSGEIDSVAETHYAFMGAANPRDMEKSAKEVIGRMQEEGVNTVFLAPV
ncbi:MAG: glycine/betaine/sarcosine/D-proline family reductase selenoprotein B [Acidiferrobacterales bacterium]|nr:glycine/betaine/sarcosine/D-proline family reductase selenoprotein B [Acidiferrobacterales bacterium]